MSEYYPCPPVLPTAIEGPPLPPWESTPVISDSGSLLGRTSDYFEVKLLKTIPANTPRGLLTKEGILALLKESK